MWSRARRLGVAGTATAIAAASLVGCAKTPAATLALAPNGNGGYDTLVYQCGDDRVSRIVAHDGPTGREWAVDRPVYAALGSGTNAVLSFPLFVTPAGWHQAENNVSSFEPNRRYEVRAVTTNGRRAAVAFTAGELQVGQGKVLAGEERNLSTVTRDEFARRAATTCD
jgi:hypothetical protein